MNNQTQGNNTARANGEAVPTMQTYLAVTAQAYGIHLDGLDHRPPVSDHGTIKTQRGFATTHHRDIGRRTAHVGNNRVLQTAECASAQHAGCRPREHGTDRALHRTGHIDQRTVAFDNHQRRVYRAISQCFLDRIDQCFDMKNHPCVECDCECAPGCA